MRNVEWRVPIVWIYIFYQLFANFLSRKTMLRRSSSSYQFHSNELPPVRKELSITHVDFKGR